MGGASSLLAGGGAAAPRGGGKRKKGGGGWGDTKRRRGIRRAVDLAPTAIDPRLNLATALMRQYDPGSPSAENIAIANRSHLEFLHAFDLDPNNWMTALSISVLLFGEASGTVDERAQARILEESRGWYRKAVALDPGSRRAWYWIVRDAWSRWYPYYSGPFPK